MIPIASYPGPVAAVECRPGEARKTSSRLAVPVGRLADPEKSGPWERMSL
jgi:hypothetical protein